MPLPDASEHSRDGDKPCRSCTDFKAWMRSGPTKIRPPKEESSPPPPPTADEQSSATLGGGVVVPSGPSTQAAGGGSEQRETAVDQAVLDQRAGVCPPDRSGLGAATWTFLHSVAAYFPAQPSEVEQEDARQLMHLVSRLYPCRDCAADLAQDLVQEPPVVTSAQDFSHWLCRLHNRVNVKLGKPAFDCARIFERWRDGWKDGSCD